MLFSLSLYNVCRLCLGTWTDHGERTGGFYACNRYETAKQEGAVCNFYLYSFVRLESHSGWSNIWVLEMSFLSALELEHLLSTSHLLSDSQHPD